MNNRNFVCDECGHKARAHGDSWHYNSGGPLCPFDRTKMRREDIPRGFLTWDVYRRVMALRPSYEAKRLLDRFNQR